MTTSAIVENRRREMAVQENNQILLSVTLVVAATGESWLRNNLNKGKLENFYWMLAVLGVIINFLVFLAFARHHQVHKSEGPANDQEKELTHWQDEAIFDIGK
ncbi:hypothetical protein POM88_015068 [Heracleum sosnowskyi]|uniref:Uncharacterized protein n=1 Tax=Heracleum sosnowskyi TaxID=360622 RepID=A0AAD8IMY1_9APIA|nr:hypothetical protein POM88_015068 [Heracleum sosnowskyi]